MDSHEALTTMLPALDTYVFSPTGGTRKLAEALAAALSSTDTAHDLADRHPLPAGEADTVLIAAPVFAGRIPALVAEKVRALAGAGKRAVTLVVYGNRAYEDALLELNDCAQAAGFRILASAAFVAKHSLANGVGVGRPDGQDFAELQAFARDILAKLEGGQLDEPAVPGNRPYRAGMALPATPIFLDTCAVCGCCRSVCPTDAIGMVDGELATDAQKCILCMACVNFCSARALPAPLQEAMDQRLAHLRGVRNGNACFL